MQGKHAEHMAFAILFFQGNPEFPLTQLIR